MYYKCQISFEMQIFPYPEINQENCMHSFLSKIKCKGNAISLKFHITNFFQGLRNYTYQKLKFNILNYIFLKTKNNSFENILGLLQISYTHNNSRGGTICKHKNLRCDVEPCVALSVLRLYILSPQSNTTPLVNQSINQHGMTD